MDIPAGHDLNADQIAYWNGPGGQHWTERQQVQDILLAPVSDILIDRHPEIIDRAIEAIRRAGLTPQKTSIRGGTDGSRLSFMGLPCPNLFAGEHAFHSRTEWVSIQDMEAAVRTIVHLAMVWEERA